MKAETEGLLSTAEAARYLGVSPSWLKKERVHARGPALVRFGRRVVYRREDLDSFIQANHQEPKPKAA